MNLKNQYRVVIDEVADTDVGVVIIDMDKWEGAHYIIDPDGDERKKYKFRIIDAAKYDTVVAFNTHPILQVKYKPRHHWFKKNEDHFGQVFVVAIGVSILSAYVMGSVIMFSDVAPILKNSIWYQLGYWIIMLSTIVSGFGLLISLRLGAILNQSRTKKDNKVVNWLKFLTESHNQ